MKLALSLLLVSIASLTNIALANSVEYQINSSQGDTQSSKQYYYNFGSVRVHSSSYADLYLRNTGNDPVHIRAIYISGAAFYAWSYCPNILHPGHRCLTRVEFRPWHEGYHSGALRFKFPHDSIIVDLYGWGWR